MARELGETSLMFMVHPTLSAADMQDAVAAVRKVMGRAVLEGGARGQRSVAPGEAWSVEIGGDRAALEIRYRSLMGSNPIR